MRMGFWGKHPEPSGFNSRRAQPLTHYCLIRQDLPRGVLAAQLIHAAGESASGDLPTGTIAVALAARDEPHLASLELELRRLGIPHRAIREPDTPWNGALMAIGIVPIADRALVREVTGGLRLLR
jgi:peptidyl-tRNA hydrolase